MPYKKRPTTAIGRILNKQRKATTSSRPKTTVGAKKRVSAPRSAPKTATGTVAKVARESAARRAKYGKTLTRAWKPGEKEGLMKAAAKKKAARASSSSSAPKTVIGSIAQRVMKASGSKVGSTPAGRRAVARVRASTPGNSTASGRYASRGAGTKKPRGRK